MWLVLLSCMPPDPVFDDTGPTTVDSGDSGATGDTGSSHGPDHCGPITEDQYWAPDRNPHVLSCTVEVNGGVLTLTAGTQVVAAPHAKLEVGGAGPGSILVLGTVEQPVQMTSQSGTVSDTGPASGGWPGLYLHEFAGGAVAELHHLLLSEAGESDGIHRAAGLFVEAPGVVVEEVHVTSSEGYGFALAADGSFGETSQGLHVSDSAVSAFAEVWATGSIPDGDLTGNAVDAIDLPGGQVKASATWQAQDVAYRLMNDTYVDGTDQSPAVLTLGTGTVLRFGDGRGLYVGTTGPASLVAVGTEESPIQLLGDRRQPGSWAGVGIKSQDQGSRLEHFELAYGGASFPLDGALHLEDAATTVDQGSVHHNAECGIWIDGGSSVVGEAMTYEQNAEGDVCR